MNVIATQIFWKPGKPRRISWHSSNCSSGSICCHNIWDKKPFLFGNVFWQNIHLIKILNKIWTTHVAPFIKLRVLKKYENLSISEWEERLDEWFYPSSVDMSLFQVDCRGIGNWLSLLEYFSFLSAPSSIGNWPIFPSQREHVSECKSCPAELSVSYNGSLKKADSKDDIVCLSFQNCRVHKFQKDWMQMSKFFDGLKHDLQQWLTWDKTLVWYLPSTFRFKIIRLWQR